MVTARSVPLGAPAWFGLRGGKRGLSPERPRRPLKPRLPHRPVGHVLPGSWDYGDDRADPDPAPAASHCRGGRGNRKQITG